VRVERWWGHDDVRLASGAQSTTFWTEDALLAVFSSIIASKRQKNPISLIILSTSEYQKKPISKALKYDTVNTMKVSLSALTALCLSSSAAAFTLPSVNKMPTFVCAATLEKTETADEAPSADDSATRQKFENLLDQDDVKKEAVVEKVEVDLTLDPTKRVQA
jgi:hypothetical protein